MSQLRGRLPMAGRELERAVAQPHKPPPHADGSGGSTSRARMTVRVKHYKVRPGFPRGCRLLLVRATDLRVHWSAEQGPVIHRSAAEITRFRALGYWDGFGVEFPPCECARCRTGPPWIPSMPG